jgi:hypothetical protein
MLFIFYFLFIPNNFFHFSQNSNMKEFIVDLNTILLTSKKKNLTWKFNFSNTWKLIEGAHKLDTKTNEMGHVCSLAKYDGMAFLISVWPLLF